jgi:hypothetical protein
MEDLRGIGPTERSPLAANLVVKGGKVKSLAEISAKEKGLTNQDDTEIMRSLGTATTKQR